MELIIEGVLAIQAGANPRVVAPSWSKISLPAGRRPRREEAAAPA